MPFFARSSEHHRVACGWWLTSSQTHEDTSTSKPHSWCFGELLICPAVLTFSASTGLTRHPTAEGMKELASQLCLLVNASAANGPQLTAGSERASDSPSRTRSFACAVGHFPRTRLVDVFPQRCNRSGSPAPATCAPVLRPRLHSVECGDRCSQLPRAGNICIKGHGLPLAIAFPVLMSLKRCDRNSVMAPSQLDNFAPP